MMKKESLLKRSWKKFRFKTEERDFCSNNWLIESSIPEPAVIPEENELMLNDEKKSAILNSFESEDENTKKEGNKKQINYLFWVL